MDNPTYIVSITEPGNIYYFQDWSLIEASISITWSKVPDDKRPQINRDPKNMHRWWIQEDNGFILGTIEQIDGQNIEHRPTHF